MPCQNKDNNPLEMYLPRSRSVRTTYAPSSTSIKFKTKRINIFASKERSREWSGKSKKWKHFSPKRQNRLIRNSDSSVALFFLSLSLSLFLSLSLSLSLSHYQLTFSFIYFSGLSHFKSLMLYLSPSCKHLLKHFLIETEREREIVGALTLTYSLYLNHTCNFSHSSTRFHPHFLLHYVHVLFSVWPDVGIKSSQISTKGSSENSQCSWYLTSDAF